MYFQHHFFAVWPGARSYSQITLQDLSPDCVLGSYELSPASRQWESVNDANCGCLACGKLLSDCVQEELVDGEWVIDELNRCEPFDTPQQWLDTLVAQTAVAPILTALRIRTVATGVVRAVYKTNPLWGRTPLFTPTTPQAVQSPPITVLKLGVSHPGGKRDPCLEID